MSIFSRMFPPRPSLDEAFKDCKTPKEVCAVVRKWVRPCEMFGDIPEWPHETWTRGYGDCDDIAHLVRFACYINGIQSDVFYYWPMYRAKPGHALVVGNFNGVAWVADNSKYIETDDPHTVAKKALNCLSVWSRRMT